MTRKHHKTQKRGQSNKRSTSQNLISLEDIEATLLVSKERDKIVKECKEQVKAIAEKCRARNTKYRDVEFDLEMDQERCLRGLAEDSESDPDMYKPSDVQRVTNIFKEPRFYIDGPEPSDIVQGKLSDCWFLSALATMSTKEHLVEQFCVERDEEIGVYGFVFFRDARWVAVIIDDFLYTSFPKFDDLSPKERQLYHDNEAIYNNVARRRAENLHFAKSAAEDSQETWVPLYEKAFAKLHGNYAALNSGYTGEAIEDLTGGVTSPISVKDILSPVRFWKDELAHAHEDRLFACSFDSPNHVGDYKRKNGLIGRHAYSVLRAVELKRKRFVVLRNPWGNHEWNGPWSDGSKEWSEDWLPALKELKHSFGADGQFVMEYKDFLENCETIDRTLLLFNDPSWTMSSQWLRVKPRPCLEWSYGDVSFTISVAKTSSIIIVLSKLDERYFRGLAGNSKWTFDFVVYRRGEKNPICASSPSVFPNQRSVNAELKKPQAGEYIVHVRLDNQSPVVSPSVKSSRDEISQTLRNAVYPNPPPGSSMSRPTEHDRHMTKTNIKNRIFLRVLADKLRSQLIASNLDTLAGKDLLELSDEDDDKIKVPLEECLEPQAVNSTIAHGDGPERNESKAEEVENEDVSEDGVTFPAFLDPDTIVLGLRVYIQNMSESPGSHVVIKGQCHQQN